MFISTSQLSALVTLHNIAETREVEGGLEFQRVPEAVRSQLNEFAQKNALQTSGCELRFNLEDTEGTVVLARLDSTEPCLVETWYGPFFRECAQVDATPTRLQIRLPEQISQLEAIASLTGTAWDPRLIRLRLPWRPGVRLCGIEGAFTPARQEQMPKARWLAYGSSITHGSCAVHPSGTYPAQAAHQLGIDLLNLGFGGGAHLEPAMADYLAERDDWTVATLELGINLLSRIEEPEFARRVDYFVSRITDAHPTKPIACIDIFRCGWDLDQTPKVEAFRRIVRDKVVAVNRPNVVHLDGLELLKNPLGLLPDRVHPSPAGMTEIAGNVAAALARLV